MRSLKGLLIGVLVAAVAAISFGQKVGPPQLELKAPEAFTLAPMPEFGRARLDAAPSRPAAGTVWAVTGYYDIVNRKASSGAQTLLDRFNNFIWHGFTVDLDGYLGADKDGVPVPGFFLGKRGHMADRVQWYLGLGVTVQNKRPTGAGAALGISVQF